jgi:glucose-1-phosphate cytidylyltransferase
MSDVKVTQEMPVFVLCGGLGTRLKEETEFRPKPMVPIGEHPILWHVMRCYARHGFRRFILCLGFKADYVKDYFRNFHLRNADFTINLKTNAVEVHELIREFDWDVTLAYTGEKNMTGSRVAQAARKYLGDAKHFAVTYGDGLTNANLVEEYEYHVGRRRIGTVLGVNPPSRFGEIKVKNEKVVGFAEKPDIRNHWINGGYFFFRRDFCDRLSEDSNCVLEGEPLVKLARDGQLNIFRHGDFWACMDTQRDREQLTRWAALEPPPWFAAPSRRAAARKLDA